MFRRVLVAAVLLFPLATERLYCDGAPITPQQFLTQAGIPLDTSSLMQALSDSRDGVLAASATILADRRQTEAIPEISSRMSAEHNEQLKLTLAQSLNILGAEEGTRQLEHFCLSKNIDLGERIRAANDLVNTNDYRCLASIAAYLSSDRAYERMAALQSLVNIPSEQNGQPETMGPKLLMIAAHDPDQECRSLARDVIKKIGDQTTKDVLQKLRSENQQ